jgi:phosphoglycerate-specific signal transduction histidine kinase
MEGITTQTVLCAMTRTQVLLGVGYVMYSQPMMEPQLKTRALRITRSLPREAVMVMADRLRLEQVIINLLRNALDATKDRAGPQIDLILSQGETAMLLVRDNGHGIADLDNLFEPFYTTKKPGEGVGLGLAIGCGLCSAAGTLIPPILAGNLDKLSASNGIPVPRWNGFVNGQVMTANGGTYLSG